MDTQLQTTTQGGVLPSITEFELIQRMLKPMLASGFLPDTIKNEAQALTIALKGRDLGIPPLQAFSHINVIKGKPTISSELMLALIFRRYPQAKIVYKLNDNEQCIIEASRPNGEPSVFSFTMEDANIAGLSGSYSWKKYPTDLLKARCISRMARSLFPECLMGCSYTSEEMGGPVVFDEEPKSRVDEPTAKEETAPVLIDPSGPILGTPTDSTSAETPETGSPSSHPEFGDVAPTNT